MTSKKKDAGKAMVPKDEIIGSILMVRGRKVMLDADLASLYEVETRVLVQAVKRNQDRFPDRGREKVDFEEHSRST